MSRAWGNAILEGMRARGLVVPASTLPSPPSPRPAKRARPPASDPGSPDLPWEFTIDGAPRTKKNHGRRIWSRRLNRAVHLPSEAHEEWHDATLVQLAPLVAARAGLPIRGVVHVCALFYRHAIVGDLVGFEQALGDLLEHAGIIGNDRQIVSWDGTRLLKDAARPRIEVRIAPAQGGT